MVRERERGYYIYIWSLFHTYHATIDEPSSQNQYTSRHAMPCLPQRPQQCHDDTAGHEGRVQRLPYFTLRRRRALAHASY